MSAKKLQVLGLVVMTVSLVTLLWITNTAAENFLVYAWLYDPILKEQMSDFPALTVLGTIFCMIIGSGVIIGPTIFATGLFAEDEAKLTVSS